MVTIKCFFHLECREFLTHENTILCWKGQGLPYIIIRNVTLHYITLHYVALRYATLCYFMLSFMGFLCCFLSETSVDFGV